MNAIGNQCFDVYLTTFAAYVYFFQSFQAFTIIIHYHYGWFGSSATNQFSQNNSELFLPQMFMRCFHTYILNVCFVAGKKVLHQKTQSLSSCFGKLIKNLFIRLTMGIPPRVSVLVCFATCEWLIWWLKFLWMLVELYCSVTFLLCCSQIECSLLKKQPISCTRASQSLWLFPPLKDTMVQMKTELWGISLW